VSAPTNGPREVPLFGVEERHRSAYLEALRALAAGNLERACAVFGRLAEPGDAPQAFGFHHVNALLDADRIIDGVAAYEAVQGRDDLSRTCRRVHAMFSPAGGAPPADVFRRVADGKTNLIEEVRYWSLIKLRAGALRYAASMPEGEGLVFEGLVGKRTGDDECFRIEVDDGREREVVTFNGGTIVLGSASQVLRVSVERRLRAFRLVVHGGRSRLWIDGLHVLRSDALLPSREPGLRFGLASVEALDTSYMMSRVRVGFGLASGADVETLAPVAPTEPWLANLGILAAREGNAQDALVLLSAALAGQPAPEVVGGCGDALEGLLPALRAGDPAVERAVALLRERGAADQAERLSAELDRRRGPVAMACHNLSIYFARNPQAVMRPMELLRRFRRPQEYFQKNYRYVVSGLSFELRYGNVLAIVGNNGAGKSTLLRALAGMLDYQGDLAVYGEARLLVMGLGVHEDLTGRENITLGCLYLGLRKREISARVDSILEFAELTEYQDLPYRFYSDGMKARLLFSIATSVDPDILLLDELLGAGDIRFRAKAMARMDDLIGRTKAMVVVTHNLSFVRERATHAIYLDRGAVRYQGDPNRAVDAYLEDNRLGGETLEGAGSYMMQEV
jgi:ABC-type polysaccharide/polyol phosphate transport system ATPase subunit